MKKIFVSGISGFIGTYIAIEGLKRAYQIVGTTRSQQKEDEVKKSFSSMGLHSIILILHGRHFAKFASS